MLTRLRYLSRRHPILLVGLLAAAFLLRPALVFASELHMLDHAEVLGAAAAEHHHQLDHRQALGQALLEGALHAAHCCGQLSALTVNYPTAVCCLKGLAPAPGRRSGSGSAAITARSATTDRDYAKPSGQSLPLLN